MFIILFALTLLTGSSSAATDVQLVSYRACAAGGTCQNNSLVCATTNTSDTLCCEAVPLNYTDTTTTGTTEAPCVDLAAPGRASDCSMNANLCQDTLYKTLMQQQCPKTCGYCGTTGTTNSSCVDLAAPGKPSDCPANANLCTDVNYRTLMAQQCPKTCRICSS